MFNYAFKSLLTRKVTTFLFLLALIVVLVVSMLAVNIYKQVEEGFFATDGKYDVVVGKRGSSTSLVMSSLFFSQEPLGSIPYSEYITLATNDKLKTVIPLAMGDSYRGSNIVGTTAKLFEKKEFEKGREFIETYEAVIGYNLAEVQELKIGDNLVSSHGLGDTSHAHKKTYKIVGILAKENTAYDNTVFTSVESLWDSHGIGIETTENHLEGEEHAEDEEHVEVEEHVEGEESEKLTSDDLVAGEDYLDERVLTSIVIRSENMQEANKVIANYKENEGIQAINPTSTLRELMKNLDLSRKVAQLLCAIIIILAFILIAIMTVVMFESNRKDVQTLRFIGLNKTLISKFVYYQNAYLLVTGVALSALLSRLALSVTNDIASNLGIVLDPSKVYALEYYVVAGVVIICILPVIIQLRKLLKEML